MARAYHNTRSDKLMNPVCGGVDIVPGTPFPACQAVNASAAGVNTVTWADGTTSAVYFTLGWNPISIINIAAGGAGGDFIAGYQL